MSDTTTCSSCGASAPSAAKFCTTCGTAMAADAGNDATHVDGPRPDSPTQVLPSAGSTPDPSAAPASPPLTGPTESPSTAASAPWAPSPGAGAQAPSQPWAPIDTGSASPAPPQAPTWGQPPATEDPPAGGPPAWQQPPAAPPYGQPPAGQPAWGAPGGQTPAWGQGPAPTASADTKTVSPLGGLVALVGGVLTLVGLFTAWVGPKGGGDPLTGWDLTKSDSLFKSPDPYFVLVLGIVALVIGVLRFTGTVPPIARVAAIVVGLLIIAIMIRDWLSIVEVVKDKLPSDVKIEQKFGYFLAIAGGVVTAASAVMPSTKKTS